MIWQFQTGRLGWHFTVVLCSVILLFSGCKNNTSETESKQRQSHRGLTELKDFDDTLDLFWNNYIESSLEDAEEPLLKILDLELNGLEDPNLGEFRSMFLFGAAIANTRLFLVNQAQGKDERAKEFLSDAVIYYQKHLKELGRTEERGVKSDEEIQTQLIEIAVGIDREEGVNWVESHMREEIR